MLRTVWVRSACLGLLLVVIPPAAAQAQRPRSSGPQAVDAVTLKKGGSLRGAILQRQPDGSLLMAVSHDWLHKVNPERYAVALEEDGRTQRAAWTQLQERLDGELEQIREPSGLVLFLRQERDRMADLLAERQAADCQFFAIKVPQADVAKISAAAPDRQRLALFAWHARLADVEQRDAAAIKQALAAAKVDVTRPVPDLSDRLPAQMQDDSEWAARLAIVTYGLGEPLEFQGFGDVLVRTGSGRPVNAASILPKLLEQQVQSLLGDLLEPGQRPAQRAMPESEWLKPAIAAAEKSGRRGFRVTRLNLYAARSQVAVETRFVARLDQNRWTTIWQHVETADGTQARPDEEAAIAKDPQVKSVVDGLKALSPGADAAVLQAIRVGAATQAAQQAADGRFFAFRDRYLKRLDGPPLLLPEPPP